MPTEVVMPQMGESIFEGTITKWLKKAGEAVEKDEPLFEISTDKVDAEIPAPVAGVLSEIKVQEGATVQVNTVVAILTEAGEAAASARVHAAPDGSAPPLPAPSPAIPAPALRSAGTDVVMPQMGESIFEGTITKWLKAVGDSVEKDEPLFEISTDKVDAEIPCARRRRLDRSQVR
jgi:pyruvate dehydrogenase E2 component (dihydrolipoamide acetyltransferase)